MKKNQQQKNLIKQYNDIDIKDCGSAIVPDMLMNIFKYTVYSGYM